MTSTSRPYRTGDRDACLGLFDSNVPAYFAPVERAGFAAFLDDLPGPYFVLVDEREEIVACGGYAVRNERRAADLCWGIVRGDLHRRGLGESLTRMRIAAAAGAPGVDRLELNTSQHTTGFYERLGFRTVRVVPDGYGPGLDRCDMVREVDPAASRASGRGMRIRPAVADDAVRLTRIARAAKASWGYPVEWLVEWTPVLTITAQYIAAHVVLVAERDGSPIAMAALEDREGEGEGELGHLWVVPECQGSGVGRALLEEIRRVARARGWSRLRIESDPGARPFYERMGATWVGDVAAPVAGVPRTLPVLHLEL